MPKMHAILSASSSNRWIHCPGSVALSELCPAPEPSPYADEGTLAHSLAELKLKSISGELSPKTYYKETEKIKADELYSGEMDEATDFYADNVIEAYAAAGEDAALLIEQRVDFSRWVPQGFGTSDAVVIGGRTIQVIDLKYGKGVKVDAKGNSQLRLYGLGALALFSDLYDLQKIRLMIIQPRLNHVDTEEMDVKELLLWAENEVKPRALMAMSGTGYTAVGEWCRFCPAKAVCRKRAEYNLELARKDFKEPGLLTDDEIGEVLRRADELKAWAADVSDYALKSALEGRHFDGWKLVEGRSVRKYADEDKAAEALEKAGFDQAMLYDRRLKRITDMEKMVGKKKFSTILGDLIIKPAGAPKLAPESDKRPAISTTETAKADFKDDEDAVPLN